MAILAVWSEMLSELLEDLPCFTGMR